MHYDPDKHHRRSIRMQGYDYAQAGAYFITICTHHRESLFGEVQNDMMNPNIYGKLVAQNWQRLSEFHSNLSLDAFVVMPNHLHGILILRDVGGPLKPIGEMIGRFKGFSTKAVNQLRKSAGMALWQRNYYEQVVRSEVMLNAVREYILQNPAKWSQDTENVSS
jgi:putative transposase